MLCLRVIEGPDAGNRLPLPPDEPQLLGRSSEALPMTDTSVSRRHAELTPDGNAWFVRDLDSAAGTLLNGAPLTGRVAVEVGDTLRCGHTLLVVEHSDTPLGGPARADHAALRTTLSGDNVRLDVLLEALSGAVDGDVDRVQAATLPDELADAITVLATNQKGLQKHAQLAAMGEGVASVSHAIKNILQGLQGGAGALSLALQQDNMDMAKQAWPILSRNLDRISDLALNMLAFARPRPIVRRLHSLAAVLDEVALLVETPFAERKVRLRVEPDPDLPPLPLDAAAMHQALLNLVLNALQAAPPKTGCVQVGAGIGTDTAWITVADNGPGVPEGRRTHIFEPFASDRGQRGTGLGLPVTRRIARQHGGDVTVTDGPEGGAVFTMQLSLDLPGQDADETDIPKGAHAAPDPRFDR